MAAIATLAAGAATIWLRQSDDPRPLSTLSVAFPADVRFQEWGPDLALSPDGGTLVYAPRGPFRLRRLDRLDERTLPGTQDGWGPFFSPDGKTIGYFQSGRLLKAPVEGGSPVVLANIDVDFTGAADWGRNDEIVYGAPTPEGSHGLYRVAATGGRPQIIATLDGGSETAYWLAPQWIDDGNAVLCTVARSSPAGTSFQAVVVSVGTGQPHVLIDDARHARDIGGLLVYWRRDALLAARFDSKSFEVRGPHVSAWENVGLRVRNRSWAYAADTLVYWPRVRAPRRLVWVDRNGREEPLRLPAREYHAPRLSPDGRQVAVLVDDVSSEFGDVWTHDLATGANVQVTHGGRSGAIAWTRDGAHLIVSMRQGGATDLYRVSADGSGVPERLPALSGFLAAAVKQPVGWTADGSLVLFQDGMTRHPPFWAVTLESKTFPRAILPENGTSGRTTGSVSTDGRWLAVLSHESGKAEVYVAPLPQGRPRWRVSSDGGRLPLWSRSGRELFYRNGSWMMVVPVTGNGTFVPGQPRELFEADFYEVATGEPDYDVSADDQRFLIVPRGRSDGPERLNVIQPWRREIERRLRDAG